MTSGADFRQRREAADVTRERIAQLSHLSVSTVRSFERGKSDPRQSTVDALEAALDAALGQDGTSVRKSHQGRDRGERQAS